MAEPSDPRAHREAIQRVQVGVIGLVAVLLVVALANIVVRSVRTGTGQVDQIATGAPGASEGAANAAAAPQTEPFADLGVVTPKAAPVAAVPDLEPDPRLTKPMDQDPKKQQPRR